MYSLAVTLLPSNLVEYFGKHACRHIEIAEKQVCTDMNHFERYFQDIIDKGGEGIILRDPRAPFQPGRSPGYLKHKVSPLIIYSRMKVELT